jgi:hypothetical protein
MSVACTSIQPTSNPLHGLKRRGNSVLHVHPSAMQIYLYTTCSVAGPRINQIRRPYALDRKSPTKDKAEKAFNRPAQAFSPSWAFLAAVSGLLSAFLLSVSVFLLQRERVSEFLAPSKHSRVNKSHHGLKRDSAPPTGWHYENLHIA